MVCIVLFCMHFCQGIFHADRPKFSGKKREPWSIVNEGISTSTGKNERSRCLLLFINAEEEPHHHYLNLRSRKGRQRIHHGAFYGQMKSERQLQYCMPSGFWKMARPSLARLNNEQLALKKKDAARVYGEMSENESAAFGKKLQPSMPMRNLILPCLHL